MKKALIISLIFMISSCVKAPDSIMLNYESGVALNKNDVLNLQKNKSTCEDIKQIFGIPKLESVNEDATRNWNYQFSKWSYARKISQKVTVTTAAGNTRGTSDSESGLEKVNCDFSRLYLTFDNNCKLSDYQFITTW